MEHNFVKDYTVIFNFNLDSYVTMTVLYKGEPILIGDELKNKILDKIGTLIK